MGKERYLKQEADEVLDLEEEKIDLLVDDQNDLKLNLIKSTQDSFLTWKDYHY